MKLVQRFLNRFAKASGAFLALMLVIIYGGFNYAFVNLQVRKIQDEVEALGASAGESYMSGDILSFEKAIRLSSTLNHWTAVRVSDPQNGTVLFEESRPSDNQSIVPGWLWKLTNLASNENLGPVPGTLSRTVPLKLADGVYLADVYMEKTIDDAVTKFLWSFSFLCLATILLWSAYLAIIRKLSLNVFHRLSTVVALLKTEGDRRGLVMTETQDADEISTVHRWFVLLAQRWEEAAQTVAINSGQKVLQDVSAQLAHDLRSPLSAIRIAADSLKRKNIGKEEAEMIQSAVERLCAISEEILLPVRERAATVEMSPLVSALASVIESKRADWVNFPNVNLMLETPHDTADVHVAIEITTLKRIADNLLNNSFQALPQSAGNLSVYTRRVDEAHVQISFVDDGIGIPPEVLNRVGTKGFTHGKDNGTGLGVYFARQTIIESGGNFEVLSDTKLGTVVRMTLPIVTA